MLTTAHWLFIVIVLIVIVIMGLRKDVVIPCSIGLFLMGWVVRGTFLGGIQAIYNGIVAAGNEFLGIVVVISLVVAMSKALADSGADYLIMRPAAKLMVNADMAYWILGITMMIISWMVWPSPAVALIGAIMLPVALKAGLPAIGAAMAMNLFGHGIGLSSDWIIQGAPAISAKSANLASPGYVTTAGIPLFFVMGLVTTIVAYMMIKRDMKNDINAMHELHLTKDEHKADKGKREFTGFSYFVAWLTPIAFALDVVAMIAYDLKGGDATALVGGTAVVIMVVVALGQHKLDALEVVSDYVRQGFMFGIKIFAPVFVIGAFFFLGGESTAKAVLGPEGRGYMVDLAQALSQSIPLGKLPVGIMEMAIGAIIGMDGSGFAPLPLTGAFAGSFGTAIGANVGVLAAMGQIAGVWTGGGTIIPWGLIPVAAIVGVDPIELARKNFIPVMAGFAATLVLGVIIM